MKLAIVGSRNFHNYSIIEDFICAHYDLDEIDTIISGGANGVDTLAEQFARNHHKQMEIFPAEWKKYGKSAGPRRNRLIVENADAVVAFPANDSRGTMHSISLAKQMCKRLEICDV